MSYVETPENRLGKREKPFHFTGEISAREYFERLTPDEQQDLAIILERIQSLSVSLETPFHILAVGSSADLAAAYGDIDLLVCPEDKQVRFSFVRQLSERLRSDKRFVVLEASARGSAPVFNPHYSPLKLFVLPRASIDQGLSMSYDLTFLGETGGSFDEPISFHRDNNLAFSILNNQTTYPGYMVSKEQ